VRIGPLTRELPHRGLAPGPALRWLMAAVAARRQWHDPSPDRSAADDFEKG
jgi:hypothetical protein